MRIDTRGHDIYKELAENIRARMLPTERANLDKAIQTERRRLNLYDQINDRVNNTIGDYIERLEITLNQRRMRRRYRWQERRIRFERWSAGLHFWRIPETRWTLPISVCLAPSVGLGVSTAAGIVGVRWSNVMTIRTLDSNLKVRKREGYGFFVHRHTTTEVW